MTERETCRLLCAQRFNVAAWSNVPPLQSGQPFTEHSFGGQTDKARILATVPSDAENIRATRRHKQRNSSNAFISRGTMIKLSKQMDCFVGDS